MGKVIKANFGPRVTETTKKLYQQAAEQVGTSTLAARPDGPKGAPLQEECLNSSFDMLTKVVASIKANKAGLKKTSQGWETPDGLLLADEDVASML